MTDPLHIAERQHGCGDDTERNEQVRQQVLAQVKAEAMTSGWWEAWGEDHLIDVDARAWPYIIAALYVGALDEHCDRAISKAARHIIHDEAEKQTHAILQAMADEEAGQ